MKGVQLSRGFTVLELLIVIAIITILAAVVLVSFNASRGKGKDAAIKQQLIEVRNQAEIFYAINGTYCKTKDGGDPPLCLWGSMGGFSSNCEDNNSGTVFAVGEPNTVGDLLITANLLSRDPGEPPTYNGRSCFMNAAGTKWVTTLRLNSVDERWCIDSSGNSKSLPGDDEAVRNLITQDDRYICL